MTAIQLILRIAAALICMAQGEWNITGSNMRMPTYVTDLRRMSSCGGVTGASDTSGGVWTLGTSTLADGALVHTGKSETYVNVPTDMNGGAYLLHGASPWPGRNAGTNNWALTVTYTAPVVIYIYELGNRVTDTATAAQAAGFTAFTATGFARQGSTTKDFEVYVKTFTTGSSFTLSGLNGDFVGGVSSGCATVVTQTTTTTTLTTQTVTTTTTLTVTTKTQTVTTKTTTSTATTKTTTSTTGTTTSTVTTNTITTTSTTTPTTTSTLSTTSKTITSTTTTITTVTATTTTKTATTTTITTTFTTVTATTTTRTFTASTSTVTSTTATSSTSTTGTTTVTLTTTTVSSTTTVTSTSTTGTSTSTTSSTTSVTSTTMTASTTTTSSTTATTTTTGSTVSIFTTIENLDSQQVGPGSSGEASLKQAIQAALSLDLPPSQNAIPTSYIQVTLSWSGGTPNLVTFEAYVTIPVSTGLTALDIDAHMNGNQITTFHSTLDSQITSTVSSAAITGQLVMTNTYVNVPTTTSTTSSTISTTTTSTATTSTVTTSTTTSTTVTTVTDTTTTVTGTTTTVSATTTTATITTTTSTTVTSITMTTTTVTVTTITTTTMTTMTTTTTPFPVLQVFTGSKTLTVDDATAFMDAHTKNPSLVEGAIATGIAASLPGVDASMVTVSNVRKSRRLASSEFLWLSKSDDEEERRLQFTGSAILHDYVARVPIMTARSQGMSASTFPDNELNFNTTFNKAFADAGVTGFTILQVSAPAPAVTKEEVRPAPPKPTEPISVLEQDESEGSKASGAVVFLVLAGIAVLASLVAAGICCWLKFKKGQQNLLDDQEKANASPPNIPQDRFTPVRVPQDRSTPVEVQIPQDQPSCFGVSSPATPPLTFSMEDSEKLQDFPMCKVVRRYM